MEAGHKDVNLSPSLVRMVLDGALHMLFKILNVMFRYISASSSGHPDLHPLSTLKAMSGAYTEKPGVSTVKVFWK